MTYSKSTNTGRHWCRSYSKCYGLLSCSICTNSTYSSCKSFRSTPVFSLNFSRLLIVLTFSKQAYFFDVLHIFMIFWFWHNASTAITLTYIIINVSKTNKETNPHVLSLLLRSCFNFIASSVWAEEVHARWFQCGMVPWYVKRRICYEGNTYRFFC